ncbi:unnamed protein product [Oncorhynchus mykiss]|uniref:Rho-GAP domain-containing protein n=1 Tax=Oncorhynchus mykiss TaxID=8022 RepID=A0A060W7A9_ONCMY|nr:unnamed protein product [Oncorhynchus mykiss]
MTEILVSDVNLNTVCERLEQQCCVEDDQQNNQQQLQQPQIPSSAIKRHTNTGAKLWGRVRSKLLRQKLDPQTVQSKNWHVDVIEMNGIKVEFSMKFTSRDLSLKRTPSKKQSGVFGVKISIVTKRERSKVPYIVRQCIEEVEKRGIDEVGIYRISGVATDIQALKAAFDTIADKEPINKMSLHNLGTVFGPTLLRPSESEVTKGHITLASDIWSHDVMAQVQVLLYYLQHPPISFAELKRNTLYFSTDV